MLIRIIHKEILEHLMSLRFAIACVLCFVVILASLFVRGQEYDIVQDDYREDMVELRKELKDLDHPWRVVWRGLNVYRPPNALKIFVRGVEEGNGLSVRVNSHQPPRIIGAEMRSPLMLLFPAMDLVNFVGIIMSLLAVVFAYDAVCGEKERGTLRLMLSYSIPRDRVLLGKWIGGYVALVIPFLLAIVCGAAVVLVQPEIDLTAAQWRKLAAVCAVALLYVASVYSLALWVSCLTRRAATSVMVLVTVWLVLVLAVPNLSPHVARALLPTTNPLEVELTRAEARREIWDREVEEKMDAYDEANGFGERWWEGINWDKWEGERERGVKRRLFELNVERAGHLARLDRYARLDADFQRQLDTQVGLSRAISRLSPFSCFAGFATEVTDTGVTGKRHFLDRVREHQLVLCKYGHDEWRAMTQYEMDHMGERGERWNRRRVQPIPVFAYKPPVANTYRTGAIIDIGILAGSALVFFLLSFVTFLRYDVR